MNLNAFVSVCERLENGQTLRLYTTSGRVIVGCFINFLHTSVTAPVLMVKANNQTLAFCAPQLDRIVILEEHAEDTFNPSAPS